MADATNRHRATIERIERDAAKFVRDARGL
jgi:hypothetical protein